MAPITSHDPFLALRSLWSNLNEHIVKRSGSSHVLVKRDTPVAGFAAVIGILSAIILGYTLYRTIKWLRRRQALKNGPLQPPSERILGSKSMKQGGRTGEVSAGGAHYAHFPTLTSEQGQGQTGLLSPPSTGKSEFDPLRTPKFEAKHAPFHPDLEHGSYSSYPVYPAQTYTTQGKGGFGKGIGFVKNVFRGKQVKNEEAYRMVEASSPSPMKSPPLQFTNENYGAEEKGIYQQQQRVGSMPLPPLPPPTPDITTVLASANVDGNVNASSVAGPSKSQRLSRAPSERSAVAPANSATSAPHDRRQSSVLRRSISQRSSSQVLPPASTSASSTPSRSNTVKSTRSGKSVRTLKSHRLTQTTIGKHSLEITVPSPRVSSLYRSRLSLGSYTPASPNLPPPQVPPVPAIPAHLSALSAAPSSFKIDGRTSSDLPASKSNTLTVNNALAPTPIAVPPFTALDVPTHGPDGKPLPRTMVVIATFTPSLSDELPVALGETVNMLEEYIDGWCFVQRVTITDSRVKLLPIDKSKVTSPSTNGNDTHVQVPMKTETVVGDGNSGAIPRFCLADWPVSPSMLEDQQGDESEVEMDVEEDDGLTIEGLPEAAVNPFEPEVAKSTQPPSSFKPGEPAEKKEGSRFSSWGSERPLLPSLSFQRDHEQVQEVDEGMVFDATPSTAGFFSASSRVEHADHSDRMTHIDYSLPVVPDVSENSTNSSFDKPSVPSSISMGASRASQTPSISTATSSLPPPIPPQPSPVSRLPSSEHLPLSNESPSEERPSPVVRRISKPPPAPRNSRFAISPTEDSHLNLNGRNSNEERERFMGYGLGSATASATGANKRGQGIEVTMNMGMAIPRASERTMTLPPLPRPSITDLEYPWNATGPLPTAASVSTAGPSTAGASSGTSAGSHTPSTAASGHARSNSQKSNNFINSNSNANVPAVPTGNNSNTSANTNTSTIASNNPYGAGITTKRFTSAEAREPRTGGVSGPRQPPSSSRNAKNAINPKAFRTGSSVAPMGATIGK